MQGGAADNCRAPIIFFSRHFYLPSPKASNWYRTHVCSSWYRTGLGRGFSATAAGSAGALAAGRLIGTARGVLGTNLDPVRLVVDVEDALLDFVVNFPAKIEH